MPVWLQNVYEFKKLLDWHPDGQSREVARAATPEVEGQYFSGQYAPIGGVFYGARPSPSGPVFFAGSQEIPLVFGRHSVTVTRNGDAVEARLFDGDAVVCEVSYVADPVLEFDMYEGAPQGVFDWLAGRLSQPEFFSQLTQAEG